ncbi:MAG: hypothetical protein IJQ64_12185 [Prevotella sp.]|nr:hypothetical protein [Prevotella sp.]
MFYEITVRKEGETKEQMYRRLNEEREERSKRYKKKRRRELAQSILRLAGKWLYKSLRIIVAAAAAAIVEIWLKDILK